MTTAQFEYLCNLFGDPDAEDQDKWTCIRSISLEGQAAPIFISTLIPLNRVKYINTMELGSGFVLIDYNDNNLILSKAKDHISLIPLSLIVGMSFKSDYISQTPGWDWDQYDTTDPLYLQLRQVFDVSIGDGEIHVH